MRKFPKIVVSTAKVKYAEVGGIVTVGPETAKRLSALLGREVSVGEQFDLGTLAVYHRNPLKRFIANVRLMTKKNNLFTKPLK